MSGVGALVVITIVGVGGLTLAASGWLQSTPSISRMAHHLARRSGRDSPPGATGPTARWTGRLGSAALESVGSARGLFPSHAQLALVGRAPEQHALWLVGSAVGGFVAPFALVALGQRTGVIGLGWFAPLAVAVLVAAIAPVALHTVTLEKAEQEAANLRYQVSAYLDVVTMLLAGNTGYEGALEQAAHAGDGRLFAELRRRMRESGARGASLTDALGRTGRELGLDELEQVAATAALSAAEGAPVARTLAAKCATLRATLATEQETEARLRTSRLTGPIVGMALIFMALVIYPALSIT